MTEDMTDEVIDEVIVAPIETGEEALSPEMNADVVKTREEIKEEIKEAFEASEYRDEYGNSCEKLYLRMDKAYDDCFNKDDCAFLMDFNENDAFVAYCKKQMKEKFDGLNSRPLKTEKTLPNHSKH